MLSRMVRTHGRYSKKTGDIRLCIDLTKLNDAVLREKLILAAVDQTLAMLSGAAVLSKLDWDS